MAMSSTSPFIDKRIFEFLLSPENAQFTVRSLRDQYMEQYGIEAQHSTALRRFIYERIRVLITAGLIEKDREQRKRDQLFHVMPSLKEAELCLEGECFEAWHQRLAPHLEEKQKASTVSESTDQEKKGDGHNESTSHATLEKKLKETKSEFFAALGEAETFQQLMSDYPELKPGITLDYRDAHERSSRLLGNVSALEKALHRLGAP
ncbi:hypothetical protein VRRI112168_09140 [Vreelandella rituensis]